MRIEHMTISVKICWTNGVLINKCNSEFSALTCILLFRCWTVGKDDSKRQSDIELPVKTSLPEHTVHRQLESDVWAMARWAVWSWCGDAARKRKQMSNHYSRDSKVLNISRWLLTLSNGTLSEVCTDFSPSGPTLLCYNQGCRSGYFVNRFRFHTYRFRFQQNLDSNRAWALSHLWTCWQAWPSKPAAYDLQGHNTS